MSCSWSHGPHSRRHRPQRLARAGRAALSNEAVWAGRAAVLARAPQQPAERVGGPARGSNARITLRRAWARNSAQLRSPSASLLPPAKAHELFAVSSTLNAAARACEPACAHYGGSVCRKRLATSPGMAGRTGAGRAGRLAFRVQRASRVGGCGPAGRAGRAAPAQRSASLAMSSTCAA